MDRKELEKLVPSETVRKYILETGWTFTDRQKAILLYNSSGLLLQEEHLYWHNLKEETADEELRAKITVYLEYEEQGIRLFKENGKHYCVYVLKVREDGGFWDGEYLPQGYFSNWETAFGYGKKEAALFTIEKYRVDAAGESGDDACIHNPIAELGFDENGRIRFITSNEVSDEYEDLYWYFIHPFFEVPNPFERGDIVKTLWGAYGIVDSARKEWKKDVARHMGSNHHADYSDACISMIWFDEEKGTFCRGEGINPLYLERYQPVDIRSEDCNPMDRLLVCASLVCQGELPMDDLYSATVEYQKVKDDADKGKQTEKAVLDILGRSRWQTFEQVYGQVKNDFDWSDVLSCVKHLVAEGRVQTAVLCGKNQEYFCRLDRQAL